MKRHYRVIITTIILLTTLGKLRAEDDFPKIGNIYSITYSSKPEGYYWPYQVRVLKKGTGQWYLVDFDRQFNPPNVTPVPKDWDYQKRKEERWINFALLVQATDDGKSEPK